MLPHPARRARTAFLVVLAVLTAMLGASQLQAASSDKVWITASGKGTRYHRKECRTLERSHKLLELTRDEAEKRGLTPCKVCKP